MSPLLKAFYLLLSYLLMAEISTAQLPTIRKVNPTTSPAKTKLEKPVVTDTTPQIKRITNTTRNVLRDFVAENYSILRFADMLCDPDCKSCCFWQYKSTVDLSTTKDPKSKNWQKSFAWKKIPPGTVYGRWEISIQPFQPNGTAGITGVIREGLVETKGVDSVFFKIDYIDGENIQSRQTGAIMVNKVPIKIITTNPSNTRVQTNQPKTNNANNDLTVNVSNYSKLLFNINGDKKYYIRIVPLDINKNALQKISNEITLQEKFNEWKPFKQNPGEYLSNDYTITSIKYVPIYYGNAEFSNCGVVTGYNGNPNEEFVKTFMNAFPVGSTICPNKPKDKPWYEKAFNSISGFIISTIDGAATAYNDTKAYLKKKFKELNCDASGAMVVLNPTVELQKMAPAEVCEFVSGAVFEYGMAAVGLPPSLPTTDQFKKLAAGQVVDLACDKLEEETGVPIPEEAREKLKKEFRDNIEAQSNKGIVSGGILRITPHPLGQFQPAYLEIEVTRTASNYKKKGIVSFNVSDQTTRTVTSWNKIEQKNLPVDLTGNLFEATGTAVPYLENIGDKTTVYVVLKPQEMYTHTDYNTGMIKSISHSPQLGVFYTPPNPTYEGLTHTSGFMILGGGGSTTIFNIGLKKSDGLQLIFANK